MHRLCAICQESQNRARGRPARRDDGGNPDPVEGCPGQFEAGADSWIVPELRLGWRHEFGDDDADLDMIFAAQPGSTFTVDSNEVSKDTALIGAGVTFLSDDLFEVFVDYDGRINADYNDHIFSGGVRVNW